ncbi:hypothetical protein LJR235_002387 [Pararhizobium sp. LjRoot235]|uniref:hypothetical protein n=1 Tax=Pararhizobium sp. LjRoot235 TaxID=3342291 RepID=UPI003ECDC1A8
MPNTQTELARAPVPIVSVVPTGRGSYRRFEATTLEEILWLFDKAPEEFRVLTRDEVIAEWRLAEARVEAQEVRR